jgi:hypothetical protein
MAKKFLSGFERENMHEDNIINSLCMQCSEAITNPICHTCLGKEIEKWLSFYPNVKKNIMPHLKKYIRKVNNSAFSAVDCVSCRKRKAALCPYCFTEGILNLLKKNNVDKFVLGDFLSIFNFDMKHEGYIHEAIEEGLY